MENEIFQQIYGEDYPDLLLLGQQRTAIVFANFEELFEYSRPITHKLIYIGGISRRGSSNQTNKSLSKVWMTLILMILPETFSLISELMFICLFPAFLSNCR